MNISKTHVDITMPRSQKLILSLVILLSCAGALCAQTPTPSPAAQAIPGVIGEVKNIDTTTNQLIVRAESGVLSSGIVSSVNPSTREITVSSRSLMGQSQSVIIPITDKVLMRRYPPDTVPKYSEAKPSKLEEVKVNDQLRALGDKSADGTHLTAEEVVFGTFKIAGGTVTAIDAANNQIKINDLTTKKPLTIVFKPDSVIRRLPQGAAMMLGGGMGAGGGQGAGQGPGQGRPQGQGQQPGQGQGVRDSGRKALVPADRKAGACAVAAAATWPTCSNVCPRSRSMILKWATPF